MAETDLRLVIQKLDRMDETLKDHGDTLKQLSKIMTSVALQDQQLKTLQGRVDAVWERVDIVKDHQAHCPKVDLEAFKVDTTKNNNRIWATMGLLGTIYTTTLIIVISFISKGH